MSWTQIFSAQDIESGQPKTYNLTTPKGCSIVVHNQSPYAVQITTSTGAPVDVVPGHHSLTMPYEQWQSLVFTLDPSQSDGISYGPEYVAVRMVSGTVSYQRSPMYPAQTSLASAIQAIVQGLVQAEITNSSLPVSNAQGQSLQVGGIVEISGTPSVSIANTPNVNIASGTVNANINNAQINSNIVNSLLSTTEFVTGDTVQVTTTSGKSLGTPCATATVAIPQGLYDSVLIVFQSQSGHRYQVGSYLNAMFGSVVIAQYDINALTEGTGNTSFALCTNNLALPTSSVTFDIACNSGTSVAETITVQVYAYRTTQGSLTQPTSQLPLTWDPNNFLFRMKTLSLGFTFLPSGNYSTSQGPINQPIITYGHKGLLLRITVTNVSGTVGAGILPQIQWTDPTGYTNVVATTENYITATGNYQFLFYPSVPEQTSVTQHGHINETHPAYLPVGWNLQIYHNSSATWTYRVTGYTLP